MRVGILGATGAVGQKFIRLLHNHPWFEVAVLGASERSAGKAYIEAVNWIEDVPLPDEIGGLEVQLADPIHFKDVEFVFSGLDSKVAFEVEGAFAKAGIPVISNAKNYRMEEHVPLLVPEINLEHMELIKHQTFTADGSGWIVTNPNCVAVPLSMALKPLHDAFGIKTVILTTLQAVSGAGYPGVASLDIIGNVVPFISGEEPKIAPETQKLLGTFEGDHIVTPHFALQATATRVPTINGHMISATVEFDKKPTNIEEVERVFQNWENPIADLDLPSSPEKVIRLHKNDKYPQPRLHADQDGGMSLHIGRLREAEVFDVSFIAMAHNTIRGAAGGAVLNAEILVRKGYLD